MKSGYYSLATMLNEIKEEGEKSPSKRNRSPYDLRKKN